MQNILSEVKRRWPDAPPPTGEIAPSQLAPALYQPKRDQQDLLAAGLFRWGFPGFGSSRLVINARSETAAHRPMFAQAFKEGRLILPASSFFEWKKEEGQTRTSKTEFKLAGQGPVFMAGLARLYPAESGGLDALPRFVILTTAANESVRPVHDRMPLLLERADLKRWIFDEEAARQLLVRPVNQQLLAKPS